jgi:hypothetical protein
MNCASQVAVLVKNETDRSTSVHLFSEKPISLNRTSRLRPSRQPFRKTPSCAFSSSEKLKKAPDIYEVHQQSRLSLTVERLQYPSTAGVFVNANQRGGGEFYAIFVESCQKSMGKILAMFQVYARDTKLATTSMQGLSNMKNLLVKVLSLMPVRGFSRRYYLYSPARIGLFERHMLQIQDMMPVNANVMPAVESMFALRQMSEAIMYCTGHTARSTTILLEWRTSGNESKATRRWNEPLA